MAYNKQHPVNLADRMIDVGVAFGDGFQLTEDSDEIMAVVPAIVASADEFKEDTASALMHLGSRLMDKGADMRRAEKDAEAQPPSPSTE